MLRAPDLVKGHGVHGMEFEVVKAEAGVGLAGVPFDVSVVSGDALLAAAGKSSAYTFAWSSAGAASTRDRARRSRSNSSLESSLVTIFV